MLVPKIVLANGLTLIVYQYAKFIKLQSGLPDSGRMVKMKSMLKVVILLSIK